MKKSDMFPSKYLKAGDFDDGDQVLTIREVAQEDVGSAQKKEQKPVVYFEETDKGMVLNKTNWNTIEKVLGLDDTDDWAGHRITLYATEVEFQGDMVMSIRVRLKKPAAKNAPGNDSGKAAVWKALSEKHAGESKDALLKRLNDYVEQFYPGQTPATLGAKQWKDMIDTGFDVDRLAMAGGSAQAADGDDAIPF